MSFNFDWSACEEKGFATKLKGFLTDALKRIAKPSIIIDDIVVKDLVLGDSPPRLEILDIGDVAEDRFRGIFKLNYTGNASITLTTTVEANPLRLYDNELTRRMDLDKFATPTFVAASESLPMPLNLCLSEIKLSGIIILVISKAKGLTLVFRNDPLESIKVSSSLDAVPMLSNFLQIQIEEIIRTMFREQLPSILHRISKKYTPEGSTSTNNDDVTPRPARGSEPKHGPDAFVSLNGDFPDFSLSNILKLETLCASQRTLNLFTPSIPDAVYRSNLEAFDNASKGIVLDKVINADLDEVIRAYQSKSSRNIKPRRRVVKLHLSSHSTDSRSNASHSEEPLETKATAETATVQRDGDEKTETKIKTSTTRTEMLDSLPAMSTPIAVENSSPREQVSVLDKAAPKGLHKIPEIAVGAAADIEESPDYFHFSSKQREPLLVPIHANRDEKAYTPSHLTQEYFAPGYKEREKEKSNIPVLMSPAKTPSSKPSRNQSTPPKQEFFKNFFLPNTHSDIPPPYVA